MLHLLFLLTFIPTVEQQQSQTVDSCIVELMNLVTVNWKYEPDSNYYSVPQTFFKTVDSLHKNCLIRRDRKTIKMIFGQPTHKGGDTYEYQIGPRTRDFYSCYQFRFSNTGRLIEIGGCGYSKATPSSNN